MNTEDSTSKNTDLPKMTFLQDWVDEYDNTHREVIPDKPTITDNRTMIRDAPVYKPLKPNKIIKLKSSTIKAYTYSVNNMYEKSSGEPTATVGSVTPASAVSESKHRSKRSQQVMSDTDAPKRIGPSKTNAGKEEPNVKGQTKANTGSEESKIKDPSKAKAVTNEAKSNVPMKAKAVTNEAKSNGPMKAKAVTNEAKSNGPMKAKAVTNERKRPSKANARTEEPSRQYQRQKQKVIDGVPMTRAQVLRAEALYKKQQSLQTSENAILYGKQKQDDTKLPIVQTRESANYEAARQADVADRLSTPKIWQTEYKEQLVTNIPQLVLSARSNEFIKVRTTRPTVSKRNPTKQERSDTPRPDSTVQRFDVPFDAIIEKRIVQLARLKEYLKSSQMRIITRIKHPRIFDLRTFVQSPLETIQEVDEEVELAEAEAMEAVPDDVPGEVSPSRITPSSQMAEIFAALSPETSIPAVAIPSGKEREVKSEPRQLVSNGKVQTSDDTLLIHSVPATETELSRVDAPTSVAEMTGLPDKDLLLAKARAEAASYSYDMHARVVRQKSSSVAEMSSSVSEIQSSPEQVSFIAKARAMSTNVGIHSRDDNPKSSPMTASPIAASPIAASPVAASPVVAVSCSPDSSGRSSVASSRPKSVLLAPPDAAMESPTDCSVSKQLFLNAVNGIPSNTQVADDSWVEGKAQTPQAERKPASRSSSVNAMRDRSLHVAVIPARLSNTVAAVPVPPQRPRTSPQTKHTRRNPTKQQRLDVPEEDVTNNSEHALPQMFALSGPVLVVSQRPLQECATKFQTAADVMVALPPAEVKTGNSRCSRSRQELRQPTRDGPARAKPVKRRHQTSKYRTAFSSTPPAHLALSLNCAQSVDELGTNNSVRNQLPHIDSVYSYTRPTK